MCSGIDENLLHGLSQFLESCCAGESNQQILHWTVVWSDVGVMELQQVHWVDLFGKQYIQPKEG